MKPTKRASSPSKKHPPGSFMGRLKERKIIATLAAFIGGGWLTYEVVHWVLVDHYHLPNILKDITIVTFLGALLSTVIWLWFRGAEKRPGNVKVEVLVVPLIILLTLVIDLKFIFVMTGVSINMLLIGIVALCLGIAWVVFKSLQWAASAPEAEKKVEVLKPEEKKPISFPEWEKSIVVLPFENISPEEGQDYFCDGMTEEIITDLSKIHTLRVISRGSAMTLKGTKRKAREIAEELNVQYVLEGSVRKAGNDLKITAQLIDAASDAHLWAEKYSGTMDDVFNIQEKVSRSIVDSLKIKLSSKEERNIQKRKIENVKAYEQYLLATHEIWKITKESLSHAIQLLNNKLDSFGRNDYLLIALGTAYFQYVNAGIDPDEKHLDKANELVEEALSLNPDLSKAYYLRSMIQETRGEIREAFISSKRAVELDPNDSEAVTMLGWLYTVVGKSEEAKPYSKHAIELDPLYPLAYFTEWWINLSEGRFDKAVETCFKMFSIDKDNLLSTWAYAHALVYNNKLKEAKKLLDSMAEKYSDQPFALLGTALRYTINKEKQEALKSITENVEKAAEMDHVLAWWLADVYALIGEKEKAIYYLERATRENINYPLFSKYDPLLENIRGEKRFKKLMERVKHEWENFEV